jgi:dTDP-4-amino-4,6-dideoxy-D-galactose acyltransferase
LKTVRDPRTCDILEWDSAFFGHRIARFRPRRCTAEDVTAIVAECAEGGIDCVYILVDVSDTESIAEVQAKGAYLADIRVTFRTDVAEALASELPPRCPRRVRPAIDADIPALRRIAAVSHRDTRFYADRRFSPEQCNRLYELWIEKSCQGYADAVLVVEDDTERPAGYVTCKRDGEAAGHIGLFAVGEDARGQGAGRQLLAAALRWFSINRVMSMTVATQLRNVEALQFYGRAGLLVVSSEIWFHLWPRDIDA